MSKSVLLGSFIITIPRVDGARSKCVKLDYATEIEKRLRATSHGLRVDCAGLDEYCFLMGDASG